MLCCLLGALEASLDYLLADVESDTSWGSVCPLCSHFHIEDYPIQSLHDLPLEKFSRLNSVIVSASAERNGILAASQPQIRGGKESL